MTPNHGHAAYAQSEAATASPARVVLLAYERILTACDRATEGAGNEAPGWVELFHFETTHAQAILAELASVLAVNHPDKAVADMSTRLSELYRYCTDTLIAANLTKDAALLADVHRTITGLRDAWQEGFTP